MTDDPLTDCPECGAHIRRVLYPAGVVFKGSGFYKTDHSSTSAVASETNGDGKKAESTNGNAKPSQGENKSSSESSTASSSNNAKNASASGSKSTTPAGTK
jgi:predicted nucleic acid-binding Zn ribbon protein